MDGIFELIVGAFAWLKNLVKRVIRGILNFTQHIVGWFRGLHLNQSRHTPFLANANKPEFKQLLAQAPKKDVGIFAGPQVEDMNAQVFKGVYDIETDEIIHSELLGADQMDQKTKNVLGSEALVVLS